MGLLGFVVSGFVLAFTDNDLTNQGEPHVTKMLILVGALALGLLLEIGITLGDIKRILENERLRRK